MRTNKVGKAYETVEKESICSSRIYRTDKVFYRGRPTLVAIPTDDDFFNWKTNWLKHQSMTIITIITKKKATKVTTAL